MRTGDRILYIDATAGAAGDMILGALVDLGVPLGVVRDAARRLPIDGWTLSSRFRDVHGIRARKIRVGTPETGGEAGPHRTWRDVSRIIRGGRLTADVEQRALAIFRRLFEAEARVHGRALAEVHLHEAGAADALIDIVGTCAALAHLAPDRIVVSTMTTGSGRVRCRHGEYPVPAPATLELLRGAPMVAGAGDGERLTPTGAAILTTIADTYGAAPAMTPDRIGYGAGDHDFPDRPNVVRMTIGRGVLPDGRPATDAHGDDDRVVVVECAVDDATPQALAYAAERLFEAGALDVMTAAVTMKKGRVGHLLTILGRPADRERLVESLLRETTTIGLRWRFEHRVELEREIRTVTTPYGKIRVKIAKRDGHELRAWPEYEDCAAAARRADVALQEVQRATLDADRATRRTRTRPVPQRRPKP